MQITDSRSQAGLVRIFRKAESGFTVLEMVIVLAVGMVLAAIAVPMVQPAIASYRLKSTVANISGAIQSTRYQAISKGYPFKISFSKANDNYQIASDPNITGTYTNVGSAIPLTSSSPQLSQDTSLSFRPGGRIDSPQADANGITTLILTYSGRTAQIQVSNYGNTTVTYTP